VLTDRYPTRPAILQASDCSPYWLDRYLVTEPSWPMSQPSADRSA
jgi:hypothetical protein